MSARRSRFKVAASIPVRRKAGGSAEPSSARVVKRECNDSGVENVAPKNAVTDCHDPVSLPTNDEAVQCSIKVIESEVPDAKPVIIDEITAQSDNQHPNQSALKVDVATSNIAVTIQSPVKGETKPKFARPALVDSGFRRQSVHASSASESEDDSKKSHSCRTRKVSEGGAFMKAIPSFPSDTTTHAPTDHEASECARLALLPSRKRPKVSNFVRKIAEARRNFNKKHVKGKPDRSSIKMFDLLFYNPRSSAEDAG